MGKKNLAKYDPQIDEGKLSSAPYHVVVREKVTAFGAVSKC